MDKGVTLLVIDDDPKLAAVLEAYLGENGYRVISALDGLDGLKQFYSHSPDLVILDLLLPQLGGLEVCQRLRDVSDVPIIMLTGMAEDSDKIAGLRMGADDYVCKPFSLRELEARIEAVLRRCKTEYQAPTDLLYADDSLVIDQVQWEVLRKGEVVALTPTELRVLFYLVENADRVLTHQQILRHVWGSEYVDQADYPKLFVWRLRQKLEDDPLNPQYIQTVRGVGYRFASRH